MSKTGAGAVGAVVFALLFSCAAQAQVWRGMGRVGGKVVDEGGSPIAGVTVRALLPSAGNVGPEPAVSNKKGEWSIGGIARGDWALDFVKEGYETRSVTVSVSEFARLPPMEVALTKAAPVVDPNAEIKEWLTEAAALVNAKDYEKARAVYERLIAKYPQVYQFHPLMARTYVAENQLDKAIEQLRIALEKSPDNVDVQLLLGNTLIENGNEEEGRRIIESIDITKVKDPVVFVNAGISLMNEGKAAQAWTLFDRVVQGFPDQADGYYYRGLTAVQLGKTSEGVADLEKFVAMAPAGAPELPMAKELLEGLKK